MQLLVSFFHSRYWSLSRKPALGVFLVLPLWFAYEFFAYRLNQGWAGDLRTGIDLALKRSWAATELPTFILPAGFLMIAFLFLFQRREEITDFFVRPRFLAFLVFESLVYGAVLGLAVGSLTGLFFSAALAASQQKIVALVMNLGAGVYEELVFRLLLLTGLARVLKVILRGRTAPAYIAALIISAAVFSYSHHLTMFAEPVTGSALTFRFLAGLTFGLIFVFRGYGVVVYAHTFYNFLLMSRQS